MFLSLSDAIATAVPTLVHGPALLIDQTQFRLGLLKVELAEDCTRRHQTWLKFVEEARVDLDIPAYTDRFAHCASG